MLASSPAMSEPIMGPIVNPANGHEYHLLPNWLMWTEAEAEAVAMGGHLVTINNRAEQDWVWATFGGDGRALWIGLNDVEKEGRFVWTSGEPVSYTNWQPGEPNDANEGEDYGEMDALKSGRWNDLPNDGWIDRHHGLVEVGSSHVFSLSVDPGQAGGINTWTTTNGSADRRMVVFFGHDAGQTPVPFPFCAHVTLDLASARVVSNALADAAGTASFDRFIGPAGEGWTLRFQAIDAVTCTLSDVVVTTF